MLVPGGRGVSVNKLKLPEGGAALNGSCPATDPKPF